MGIPSLIGPAPTWVQPWKPGFFLNWTRAQLGVPTLETGIPPFNWTRPTWGSNLETGDSSFNWTRPTWGSNLGTRDSSLIGPGPTWGPLGMGFFLLTRPLGVQLGKPRGFFLFKLDPGPTLGVGLWKTGGTPSFYWNKGPTWGFHLWKLGVPSPLIWDQGQLVGPTFGNRGIPPLYRARATFGGPLWGKGVLPF